MPIRRMLREALAELKRINEKLERLTGHGVHRAAPDACLDDLFRALVENSANIIFIVNREYAILYMNQACQALYRGEARELLGRHVVELWGEKGYEEMLRPQIEGCLAGDSQQKRGWVSCGAAGERYLDVRYDPYRRSAGGAVEAILAVAQDLTALWRARALGAGAEFSQRERDICTLVLQGYTNLNIAERLGISESTVKFHLSAIFRKTGMHSRIQLAAMLYAND